MELALFFTLLRKYQKELDFMAAHKPKRGAPAIDMTAMVDVAFLLLTFFILTTTRFREESVVEIDTPSSISTTQLPESAIMSVEVDRDGKVFVGFSDPDIREEALKIAAGADEKDLQLTRDNLSTFSTMQNFGIPFNILQQWLQLSDEERAEFEHPGMSSIITDSTRMAGNDLRDWVRYGRMANIRRNQELPAELKRRLRFAIKGDANAPYKKIAQAIETLQDWKINQFSLITALEDRPAGYEVEEEEHGIGF